MKLTSILFVGLMTLSFNVIGQDDHKNLNHKPGQGHVEDMVKEAKSTRKKKVQMCHDCGKPESQCTCEGEEHKKDKE